LSAIVARRKPNVAQDTAAHRQFIPFELVTQSHPACASGRPLAIELARGARILVDRDFDGSGLWVCAKQMQRGCLRWPTSDMDRVQLTQEDFALLIGGIGLQ